jgi:hypothetical protein
MFKRSFVLGLAGAALYLVGTFLPSFSGQFTGASSSARVALALGWGSHPSISLKLKLAGLIFLYGGMLVVAVTSLVGLRSAHRSRWAAALVGASLVWFVSTLSGLILLGTGVGFSGEGIGVWAMYVGTGIALAAAILALVEMRRVVDPQPRTSGAAMAGFVLGVLGVGFFVFSTTLTYVSIGPDARLQLPRAFSYSLFSQIRLGSILDGTGRAVSIYGAAAIIAVAAIGGVVGRREDLWATALFGAALTWSVGIVTVLFSQPGVRIGYWADRASMLVLVIAGGIAVLGTRHVTPDPAVSAELLPVTAP